MTSIYNNTMKRDDFTTCNDPPTSGYFTYRSKEELPIFTKKKMKLNLPEDIVHLTISNNWLICLMSHNVLLRMFLPRPEKQDEVFLEKYLAGCSVSKQFFDPSGNHLFLSLTPKSPGMSSELLYLHIKNTKPKKIDKFRDHEVTAIGFNYMAGNEHSTGPILLGTSKGLIFETEFGIDGEKLYYNNWKQVFDLGREKPTPITGLDFFRVPNTNSFIVLATTIDKLYKFQEVLKSDEKIVLQNIFNAYHNSPDKLLTHKQLKNDIKYSKIRYSCDMLKKYPTQFGWLNEDGIFYAKVHQTADTPNFILNEVVIPFPNYDKSQSQQSINTNSLTNTSTIIESSALNIKLPKSFILTDFHVLLLYPDHITALSLINKSIIYEEYFSEQFGKLLNIVKDEQNSFIYVYTTKTIFRYIVSNEQRNVWKMYLDRNEFGLAEQYSNDNPAHLDIVLCKKAEITFNDKSYIESAIIYSETQTSFEYVALKFLEIDNKKPLIIYLNNRLAKLSDEDKTQITMLVIWLIELYLTELFKVNDNIDQKNAIQNDFDEFMSQIRVQKCVRNKRTVIYDLMASHGDTHNLTILTTINKDYESVINQYIIQGKYNDALNILCKQNKPELYYKYCPILMEEIPHETILAIKNQEKQLDPEKIISTLICLQTDEHIHSIINYLEYSVYKIGTTSQSLHNYLITLYAKYSPDKLEIYLEAQGRDIISIHYDVNYALRVCHEHQAKRACVFLQCLLEMWDSAVELALNFDSKLAQETASLPIDVQLKRKLWLKIAEHEIKAKNDVKCALELLKECDLLRIEDLLPFFSDFEKIDDFKGAICDALKEYNLKIQEQQRDMEDSAKSAERVREELQSLRNRHMIIKAQEKCSICEIYLMLKPFFIFPCGHKFHGDCLEKQIIQYLSNDEIRQLTNLKQQLETILTVNEPINEQQQQSINSRDQVKENIEKILASDCLYCGIMIDSIDKPFIEDWDQVNVDWL